MNHNALRFLNKNLAGARQVQRDFDIPFLWVLAQAALESGWGKSAPGNNFFGYKAGKSWTGKRQLLTTHEMHAHPTKYLTSYPEVLSVVPQGNGRFRYNVRDWFRAYDTPAEGFADYARLITGPRYRAALQETTPEGFARRVGELGYYTADRTVYSRAFGGIVRTLQANLKFVKEAAPVAASAVLLAGFFLATSF